MEVDFGGLGMESDQGSFNSPQSAGTLHERGLGKGDMLHNLVDVLGQGELSRSLSTYKGPLISEVEKSMKEKGLGSNGKATCNKKKKKPK
ncbi:hypothetical protein FH972_017795 [Carpinus fangiana]|uniref:Uncharacterized protein n=1 Tax=Carpinus fangiana TaxID=176857 RepID=A0A5N6RNE1_9ROSI|nr:hypothetical protein FH972_017795 [Carpinus fangiana]